jgi:subtilase family serine protease
VALGPLSGSTALRLDIVLRPHHAAALAGLATAVSSPGSAMRGRYATAVELRREFSPTHREVAAATAALDRRGLLVRSVSADRLTLAVSAPESTVSRAMRTGFERYRLADGPVVFTNSSPAVLPASLAPQVQAVIGLSDLSQYAPRSADVGHLAGAGPAPCAVASSQAQSGGFTASRLAAAYGMAGLYARGDTGRGVTVGVFELESNLASDVTAYERCYGIATQVTYRSVDGGPNGPLAGSGEAALDIEDVAGLAPGASIIAYRAPNDAYGPFDEMQYIVDHPQAQVVTTSWGECEQQLGPGRSGALKVARAQQVLLELAAAEGQTWLAAAGDSGSTDCRKPFGGPFDELAVDNPSSQPYVTSVGGTHLDFAVTRHESVWNHSGQVGGYDGLGAGGGGVSKLWPMPAYQSTAPPGLHVISRNSSGRHCGAAAGYCREVPDVSADADPQSGYVFYWDKGWSVVGGTSASGPLWAAVVALTDASAGCGGRRVGFLNPSLYAVASSPAHASDFYDITSGSNDYLLSGYLGGLFPAGSGYDMASGLGSPDVGGPSGTGGLAAALCALRGDLGPAVDSVTPSSGPLRGGNTVTVRGYGFSKVTSVEVGAKRGRFRVRGSASSDPTVIVVTVPRGTGRQWVTVHAAGHSSPHVPGARYTYRR